MWNQTWDTFKLPWMNIIQTWCKKRLNIAKTQKGQIYRVTYGIYNEEKQITG